MRPRPPRPWIPPGGGPANVLVVRLSALGDVIHALPVLGAIREALPQARIDWAVEDRAADLLVGREELRRIVVFPRKELRALRGRPVAWLARAAGFIRELRETRYDAALDLQGNLKSGAITRVSGARHRYGLERRAAREANHLFTTRRVLLPARATHRVERNLALVGGMIGREVAWSDPGVPSVPAAEAEARRLLDAVGVTPATPYVVLHPGTSAFGAFKRWPPERFADLARTLTGPVVVTAPPGEHDLAMEVALGANPHAVVVDTPGLDVLTALIRGARLFVGADTGPLHLAALAGTPLVGLFGPKDPAVYGPWGRRADGSVGLLRVAGRDDVACRPCELRDCADPVCMTGLAPETVLAALGA